MWKVVESERVNKSPAEATSYSSSRWCPTTEQLRALEELYKRGIRTPSTFQIQQITAQLRRMGKIEGKNVFYWFQNHKARERQKLRRRLLRYASKPSSSSSSSKGIGIARTPDVQALLYNNWATATATALSHTTTSIPPVPIQEAVLIKPGSDKTESERNGWIKQQQQLLLQHSDNGISTSRHSQVAIKLTHTNPIQCSDEELSISQLQLRKIDVAPSSDFEARPSPMTLQLFPLHGNNCDDQAHQDPVLFYEFL